MFQLEIRSFIQEEMFQSAVYDALQGNPLIAESELGNAPEQDKLKDAQQLPDLGPTGEVDDAAKAAQEKAAKEKLQKERASLALRALEGAKAEGSGGASLSPHMSRVIYKMQTSINEQEEVSKGFKKE